MLIEIKLKINFGKLNTDDRVMEEVALTVPNPTILQVKSSATITGDGALCGCKLEKILELPVI